MDGEDIDFNDWLIFSPSSLPTSPVQTPSGQLGRESPEARRRVGNNDSAILGNSPLIETEIQHPSSNLATDGTRDGSLTSDSTLTSDSVLRNGSPPRPVRVRQAATAPSSLRALKPKPLQASDKSAEGQTVLFLHSSQSTRGKLPKESRKRRRLNLEGDSYRETRDAGACASCWMRHVKCGSSTPCDRCVKAAIPRKLCCRTRVKDLSNHRPGLAHKFIDCFQDCVISWDEAEGKKEVRVWHGLHSSFSVKVTRFTPRHDITDLWWKNPTGWMKTRHTPFAIRGPVGMDIDSTSLDAYVYAQVPFILDQVQAKNQDQGRGPDQYATELPPSFRGSVIWQHTMRSIFNYVEGKSESQGMLRGALLLWAYTFLIYHALWQFTAHENHDKLGMAQLALDNHDCETLTDFNDATPLPRLLLLQIHACMEARMHLLEKSLVSALHDTYISLFNSAHDSERMAAYLTTWIYLSILEEIAWDAGRWKNLREVNFLGTTLIRLRRLTFNKQFEWPLPDRCPDGNYELATHSAMTVIAHYQTAVKKEQVSHMYQRLFDHGAPQELGEEHCPSDLNTDRNRSMQVLFRELSSFAAKETPELDRRANSTFQANDIRSLEMKFAALMIS